MKKRLIASIAVILMSLRAACVLSVGGFAVNGTNSEPVKLTVLHLNDAHGRTQAEPYISQMAKDLTADGGNVLLLDAGDRLHGQNSANLTKGASMVELMNEVGYSAMTTGNHDFNFGVERLLELSKDMDFPLLAANVTDKNGTPLFEAYTVFEPNGVKVGVFGLATPETVDKADPRITAELRFEKPVPAAEKAVKALKEQGCDVIIALCHLGLDKATVPENQSKALANVAGIDVIIDGHSHTKLDEGLVVGDALIAQTGEYGEHIGVVEITVDGGKVTKKAKLVDVSGSLPADKDITAKISALEAADEELTSKVVGSAPVLLRGERDEVRGGETNLANVITDSMKNAAGADLAIFNGGGIRGSIPKGDITMGDVLTVLPFSNIIVKVELSGADILKALEHGVSEYPEPSGQNVQVAGLFFEFDPEAEVGKKIIRTTLADGSELDPKKTYSVATIEFLTAGGDGYESLKNGKNPVFFGSDSEALANRLAANPDISEEAEGRVRTVSEPVALAASEAETAKTEASVSAQPAPPETGVKSNTAFIVTAMGIVLIVAAKSRKKK